MEKDVETQQLKESLTGLFKKFINQYDKTQVDIMFVRKMQGKPRAYKTYMMECDKNSVKGMIDGTLEYLIKEVKARTLEEYDLELSRDASLQYIKKDSVIHSETILSSITQQLSDENTLNKKVDFDKLNFVVVQLFIPEEGKKLLLFKKHIKNQVNTKSKSAVFSFNGKSFLPLTDRILTIGSNVEAFLTNDFYYILNRDTFNSMFDYKDAFIEIVERNADAIAAADMIENAQDFIEQCKNDGRYLPRLTKAILGEGFSNLITYQSKLGRIKNDYGLRLELTKDGKIIYNNPEDAPEILNLLMEHYVVSALTEHKMLAKAIEKYKIR